MKVILSLMKEWFQNEKVRHCNGVVVGVVVTNKDSPVQILLVATFCYKKKSSKVCTSIARPRHLSGS